MVGAVGIELKAVLNLHKLLILLAAKSATNTKFGTVGYTPGTRTLRRSVTTLSRRDFSEARFGPTSESPTIQSRPSSLFMTLGIAFPVDALSLIDQQTISQKPELRRLKRFVD